MDSVQSQEGVDLEHIVIDGASTDLTVDILHQYSMVYENMKIISEPDRGIYDAMNKGIMLAKGDVVAILNSDDYFSTKSVLSFVNQFFLHNPDYDAFLTSVQFVNKVGDSSRKVSAVNFQPKRLTYGWMPPHPGMFLRRNVYKTIGKFKIDYQIAADYEFCVRAFFCNHVRYKASPFLSVIMREGGVSTKNLFSKVLITKEIVRACRENNVRPRFGLLLLRLPIKKLMEGFIN